MTADVIHSYTRIAHITSNQAIFTQLKIREFAFKGFWINGKIFAEAMNPSEITWLLLGEIFSKKFPPFDMLEEQGEL